MKFDQVKELKDVQYLDCRNKPEWIATGTLENAILIPMLELSARVAELKDKKSVLVHCRTGMRARVAASILAQQGIDSIVFAERNYHLT